MADSKVLKHLYCKQKHVVPVVDGLELQAPSTLL